MINNKIGIEDTKKLRSKINNEILRKKELLKDKNAMSLTINSLKMLDEQLENIENLLSIEKYKLVFIGKIMIGKSTAISHILNLINDVNVGDSLKRAALLKTGTGKTTLTETILLNSEHNFIEIEPKELSDVKKDIEEFCDVLWFSAIDETNNMKLTNSYELTRVLRNMSGFNSDKEIKEFRQNFGGTKEDFFNAILSKMNIAERKTLRFEFSETSTLPFKDWLKSEYESINFGTNKKCPVPNKIYVNIDFKKYCLNLPPNISMIIDTRGIDEIKDGMNGTERKDIYDYIRSEDTICIFVNEISKFPSQEISVFLKKRLNRYLNNNLAKVGALVIVREDELEEVNEVNNLINNGTELKRSEYESDLSKAQINFDTNNIFFYDAFYGYERNQKNKVISKDPAAIDKNRADAMEYFENIIENSNKYLYLEISAIENNFINLCKENAISNKDKKLINELINVLDEHLFSSTQTLICNLLNTYVDEMESYINTIHVQSLRGLNNRFGENSERGLSLYIKGGNILEDFLNTSCGLLREELQKKVEEVQIESKELKSVLEPFDKQIFRYCKETIDVLRDTLSDTLKNKTKFHPHERVNSFWDTVIRRWGQGSGYKNDVMDEYRKLLNDNLFVFDGNSYIPLQKYVNSEVSNNISELFKKIRNLFV